MNGPLRMYKLRPIISHDYDVPLPTCMYKMKNIHAASARADPSDHVSSGETSGDISDQVKQFLKTLRCTPEMTALIHRQEKILQQLDELRQQMIRLKSDLSANNGPNSTTAEAAFTCPVLVNKLPTLIINASPSYPPFSLLSLQKLWSNYLQIKITTHLHSTVSELTEKATLFTQVLEKNQQTNHRPTVEVKLIWKDVGPNTELIVSQVPIMGEVNILRYLARTNPAHLTYETVDNVHEIDAVLDTCYCLVRSQTKTERNSLIQSLNKRLGKSEWLCGQSKFTIADVAACSAIKQTENEINQNMTRWMQRCEGLAI